MVFSVLVIGNTKFKRPMYF